MTEQRKTEAEPSRNPETLGEGVVCDVLAEEVDGERWELLGGLRAIQIGPARIARLIDTRFAPLIEAAEWALDTLDNKIGLIQPELETLRAAIANAKGGAK